MFWCLHWMLSFYWPNYSTEFQCCDRDVTILANRSRYMEFAQPSVKSGLSIIISVKSEEAQNRWMFMMPFTMETWQSIVASLPTLCPLFGSWSAALIPNLVVHYVSALRQPFGSPSVLFSSLTEVLFWKYDTRGHNSSTK